MSDPAKNPADDDGVLPTEADDVAKPEQPPMDDDASGLPDDDAEKLGDFA
ncbi:hypothetical protein M0208_03715 [Sphingomonas sp. SUN019]|nr:hypothetical protein [Sphingomonas sp. SUN019]UVO49659.1 hypothetical protein M0208_03715 [Sphingomonas sp. SUN019]